MFGVMCTDVVMTLGLVSVFVVDGLTSVVTLCGVLMFNKLQRPLNTRLRLSMVVCKFNSDDARVTAVMTADPL